MNLEQILEKRNQIHERLNKVPYVAEKDKYDPEHVKDYMNQTWEICQGIQELKDLFLQVDEYAKNVKDTQDRYAYNRVVKKCVSTSLSLVSKNIVLDSQLPTTLDHWQDNGVLKTVCVKVLYWASTYCWRFMELYEPEENDGVYYIDFVDTSIGTDEDWEEYVACVRST